MKIAFQPYHDRSDGRRKFLTGFHVRRDPGYGPGWYVFARNTTSTFHGIAKVAWPNKPPRKHRGYNARTQAGWSKKAEAEKAARILERAIRMGKFK